MAWQQGTSGTVKVTTASTILATVTVPAAASMFACELKNTGAVANNSFEVWGKSRDTGAFARLAVSSATDYLTTSRPCRTTGNIKYITAGASMMLWVEVAALSTVKLLTTTATNSTTFVANWSWS